MESIAMKLISTFNLSFWVLILQGVALVTVLLLLKNIGEGVTAYIFFRMDNYVGMGTPVSLNGEVGRIMKANWTTIVVEMELGYLRIPMKDWRSSGFMVMKDRLTAYEKGDPDEKI